jgi:hypothetical protein
MNAKEKGGSSYLCAKVTNARNALTPNPNPNPNPTCAPRSPTPATP